MRTTVTLDDDVYEAAKALAKASGKTLGQVLAELARRGTPDRLCLPLDPLLSESL